MTIDLDIAAYNAGKPVPPTPGPTLREIFARKRVYALSGNDSRARTDLISRLRHSTWKRHEHHNKQMQHFLEGAPQALHTVDDGARGEGGVGGPGDL